MVVLQTRPSSMESEHASASKVEWVSTCFQAFFACLMKPLRYGCLGKRTRCPTMVTERPGKDGRPLFSRGKEALGLRCVTMCDG